MRIPILLFLFFFENICCCHAQSTRLQAPFFQTANSLSILYENDFTAQTDEYYTQGIAIHFSKPQLLKLPVYQLFPDLSNSASVPFIALLHLAFTPQSIIDNFIRVGDRPYAAAFILQTGKGSVNASRKQKLFSSFHAGIIGRAAGGEWIQRSIHSVTGSAQPEGWKYQIRNDAILAYQIGFTKNLVTAGQYFSADATGIATLGTFQTRATAGFHLQAGIFSPLYKIIPTRKISAYVYYQLWGNAIAYDASLQGGLLNRSSPYVIPSSEIKRLTARQEFGLMIQYKGIQLSVFNNSISKEFSTGTPHNWGGASLTTRL